MERVEIPDDLRKAAEAEVSTAIWSHMDNDRGSGPGEWAETVVHVLTLLDWRPAPAMAAELTALRAERDALAKALLWCVAQPPEHESAEVWDAWLAKKPEGYGETIDRAALTGAAS